MTTHDINSERYREEYREPDPDAKGSSGYVADDNYAHLNRRSKFDEVLECLIEARASITSEQLAMIQEALSGKQPDNT